MPRTFNVTGVTTDGHTVTYQVNRADGITSSHSPACSCLKASPTSARIRRRRRPTT